MDGWWIGLLVAVVAAWLIFLFNRLVRKRNRVRAAWSDIDVQLTRRHDLIPELVRVVRAYTEHERSVLETVTEIRTRALATEQPAKLAAVEDELEQALARLLVLREDYPELKADGNFARLQADLVDTEDQLQYARRYYNGAVRELNDRVRQFPDLIVARLFGFSEAEFYAAEDVHRPAARVELDRPA